MASTRVERRYEGSFVAVDIDSGAEHTLDVYGEHRIFGSLSDPPQTTRGLTLIRTRDGLDVNPLGNGRYQVVQTGLILRSDDPNAPG